MKKIYILLGSTICFFALIFFSVPYIIDNKKKPKVSEKNIDLFNSINRLSEIEQEFQYSLLNKDNLYENYSHNYAIKIPEGYKKNKGIGKYSSVQFYNEQLGYVIAINIVKTGYEPLGLSGNNSIISKLTKEFKTDLSLNEIIENAIIDRGYTSPKLLNSKMVSYNNRNFLNIYYKAYQNNFPVMMSNFMTFHKDYLYFFQFVSNQSTSISNWENEIKKSMSNLFIHKFITEKN